MKIRRKYYCLFESDNELIYVHYEDLEGYIHYEYCNDGTKQIYKMTTVGLLKYRKVTS